MRGSGGAEHSTASTSTLTGGAAVDADRGTSNAALTLALVIPGDTLLYLLLPLYAPAFGVSLPEAGILLAANRLIRIFAYRYVAIAYAAIGPRTAGVFAAGAGIAATSCYTFFEGLWLLLLGRLIWGLSFATLNIINQALPTSVPIGAAERSGRSRAIIASGSMIGLLAGAVLAEFSGPRVAFATALACSLAAPYFASRLPDVPEAIVRRSGPALSRPGAFSIWSFCFGFTMDGIFVFGLSLLAKANFTTGAVLAAGVVMALRYASEMVLSHASGRMAERIGAMRLMIALSLAIAVALTMLSATGPVLWIAVLVIVLLRALVQPLPPPVLAELYPGPERVPAMARQAVWRDIGAGAGPLAAGALFPVAPVLAIWAGSAILLAAASLALRSDRGINR